MAASGPDLVPPAPGPIDLAAARRLGVDPSDPWLGTDPADPTFRDDPAPALRRLREIAPVHLSPIGAWRLSRYRDCARLLREVKSGVRHADGRPAIGASPQLLRAPRGRSGHHVPAHASRVERGARPGASGPTSSASGSCRDEWRAHGRSATRPVVSSGSTRRTRRHCWTPNRRCALWSWGGK